MATLSTSAAAKLLGVSANLVRLYADKGVLAAVRNAFGHRVIASDDVERLKRERRSWSRPHRCTFCGDVIEQNQTFCKGDDCRKRRQRIRAKRSYHARAAKKGPATMTRNEHLAWAQARAYGYLDVGDVPGAFSSFARDLSTHDELQASLAAQVDEGGRQLLAGFLDDPEVMRRWIAGFR